jgi:hypothetical protein
MGLLTGIFGGGSAPKDVSLNTANLNTGRLGDVEQMYFDRAMTDPTQISTTGQAQLNLNNARRIQDLSNVSGMNQGMFSSFANQGLEGGGGMGDMLRARGIFDKNNQNSLQNVSQNATNQSYATTATDFQNQLNQQNAAFGALPSVAGLIPGIQNQQEMFNVGIQNQQDLANQNAQALYQEGQNQQSQGLFSTLGSLGGAAAGFALTGGNPYGMMLGSMGGKVLV